MKISDVTLTLFAWDDIPATRSAPHTGRFGASQLGLRTVKTDEGIDGHAFLGSAYHSAAHDAPGLIQYLKPILIGQDPLARERLYLAMLRLRRTASVRAIGAMDIALWDIAGKAADMPIHQLIGSYRLSVPAYASSQVHDSANAYVE